MKHALRRTLNGINLVLCAGLHGGRVRQNMSVAKASNCTNLGVCVICPLLARVSSMWGFGGNWRGGLHIMYQVYSVVAALPNLLSHTVLRSLTV